jgi:hypothetical protein
MNTPTLTQPIQAENTTYWRETNEGLPHILPIGYRCVRDGRLHRVEIDEPAAQLIRTAFLLHSTGKFSVRDIANELARLGLRGKYGEPIGATGIWKMLKNPLYTGANPKVPRIIA